jgi:hypothetical protein
MYFLALVLITLALLVANANLGGTMAAYRRQSEGIEGGYSNAPLLSIIFSVLAYWFYPSEPKGWILLIPLLDLGTWSLIILPFFLLREYWKGRG